VYPRKLDFDNNICGEKSCWWLEFSGTPKYLVVNLNLGQSLIQLLAQSTEFHQAVKNMESAGKIRLEKEFGDAKLYTITYK